MADPVHAIISLVGEQPIPVLLPLLHLRPEMVILVHSDRTQTQAERIRRIISSNMKAQLLQVNAYDIINVQQGIEAWIQGHRSAGQEIWCNFSGGTKPMVLGAVFAAARNEIGLLYVESERGKSILYKYRVAPEGIIPAGEPEELPSLITIQTYIHAHVDDAQFGIRTRADVPGYQFEEEVAKALRDHVDEIERGVRFAQGQVEIDIAVRCGNQIGIMEVKSGRIDKEAIDQLHTAGSPQHLGTYTRKFWVRSRSTDPTTQALDELAEARGIAVIELLSYERDGRISEADKAKLVTKVRQVLTGRA